MCDDCYCIKCVLMILFSSCRSEIIFSKKKTINKHNKIVYYYECNKLHQDYRTEFDVTVSCVKHLIRVSVYNM